MIDFHAHLDLYPDPHEVADEAQRRGVGVLSVTTTPSAWTGTSLLAKDRPVIRTALGLHPQLARDRRHELALFDRYLSETQFVGEVGLDGSPEQRSSWSDQTAVFDHILRSCSEAGGKVISIHSRRAVGPVLDMLERFEAIRAPILHWFSGTDRELRRAIARGCWFSIGPAMLAGAKGKSLATAMPQDRVLLETDGPFAQVQRVPLKPWQVSLSCDALAELWDVDREAAEQRIRSNQEHVIEAAR